MRPFNAPPPRPKPPLVLTTTVRAFLPTWRTTVLTLSELGAAAFFVSGITQARYGAAGPWFVLVAVMLGFVVRVVDIENWALFIPGGLAGRVNDAFGPRLSMMAAAAALLERLLFVALVGIVAGRYVVTGARDDCSGRQSSSGTPASGDVTSLAAVLLVGVLWLRTRLGQPWSVHVLGAGPGCRSSVLVGVSLWGLSTLRGANFTGLPSVAPPLPDLTGHRRRHSGGPRRCRDRAAGRGRRRRADPPRERAAATAAAQSSESADALGHLQRARHRRDVVCVWRARSRDQLRRSGGTRRCSD